MSSTADASMVSAIQKTPSPINGVGRTLGSITYKLLRCTPDPDKVLKFVISLGLIYNIRIYRKAVPEKGYVTFFVSTPREDCFDPTRACPRASSYMSSFKINEEMLAKTQPLPPPYCSIEKMCWNELRCVTNNLLPEVPRSIDEFKERFSVFTPELLGQKGSSSFEIGIEVRAIRETLDDVSKKANVADLL